MTYAFDFEWSNKNLFYDSYTRTDSYFENSELASSGLPSKDELYYLEPYTDILPKEIFTLEFTNPVNDGSGYIRTQLQAATKLLKEAGWKLNNGKLQNISSKEYFKFEILLY